MDPQIIDLLKWAGPSAAVILYVLKELKERRQVDAVIEGYRQMQADHVATLNANTQALTKLLERLEPGSVLTEHISWNTQILTRLSERIETWDKRIMTGQRVGP